MPPADFPNSRAWGLALFGYTDRQSGAWGRSPDMKRENLMRPVLIALILLLAALPAWAGEADVLEVEAVPAANGAWSFNVTVAHTDEGWSHYADRWEIVAPDGRVIATRTLLHPHVREQPFTRSLSGVVIPEGVTRVIIRAHDKEHGLGGVEVTVELTR